MTPIEPGPDILLPVSQTQRGAALPAISRFLALWWVAFAASAVFVVGGHLLIKAGLNSLPPLASDTGVVGRVLHTVLNPTVLEGLVTYSLGTVCWVRAVSQTEISFLYPLSSVNYVLVAAASMVFFREAISIQRGAGVVLVVLGMILMNRQSGGPAA